VAAAAAAAVVAAAAAVAFYSVCLELPTMVVKQMHSNAQSMQLLDMHHSAAASTPSCAVQWDHACALLAVL
jgi:hypothetical protein